MIFENIKAKGIRRLRALEKCLGGITIHIPSVDDQLKAKKEIEDTLPGSGRVTLPYAKTVLIAYNYAKTRFHRESKVSMLNDIKAGKRICITDYDCLKKNDKGGTA
jgi:hypothetical protein